MNKDPLLIALVHNHEISMPSRLIAEKLSSKTDLKELIEVSDQDNFSSKSSLSLLLKHLETQVLLENSWRKYRDKQSWLSQSKATLNFLRLASLLIVVPKFRRKAWKIRQIEMAVSVKHQEAWRILQKGEATSFLILESDAVWIEDRTKELVNLLGLLTDTHPTYINLAGGLDLSELGVEKLIKDDDSELLTNRRFFKKPITNTSCAYAINRSLCDLFLTHIENHPQQKSLGIDWLINAIFLELTNEAVEVICVHAIPPVLHHGSMTGISSSWHPDRK